MMIHLTEEQKQQIENQLLELPIVQYAWISAEDLVFSDKVRDICRQECPRYGKSWSCPPGVGSLEDCEARCRSYDGAFVFTTLAEVNDVANMEETLSTRFAHTKIAKQICDFLSVSMKRVLLLSGDSCSVCKKCAYPEATCRHPEQMIPCIEGYGILVPLLAEKTGIDFCSTGNSILWFGMILFTK